MDRYVYATNKRYATNFSKLFKAKTTDSDSCHVCESKQTLEHLLLSRMPARPLLLESFYLLVER